MEQHNVNKVQEPCRVCDHLPGPPKEKKSMCSYQCTEFGSVDTHSDAISIHNTNTHTTQSLSSGRHTAEECKVCETPIPEQTDICVYPHPDLPFSMHGSGTTYQESHSHNMPLANTNNPAIIEQLQCPICCVNLWSYYAEH